MPWINRTLDYLMIPPTRQFFNVISRTVYNSTGYYFHPSVWQMTVLLVIFCAGYFGYVHVRAKA